MLWKLFSKSPVQETARLEKTQLPLPKWKFEGGSLRGILNQSFSDQIDAIMKENDEGMFCITNGAEALEVYWDKKFSVFGHRIEHNSTTEYAQVISEALLSPDQDEVLDYICPCCDVSLDQFCIEVHMPRGIGPELFKAYMFDELRPSKCSMGEIVWRDRS